MQSYRNNPDSDENAAMTRANERAVFAAKMQARYNEAMISAPEQAEALFNRWQALPSREQGNLAGDELAFQVGAHQAALEFRRTDAQNEARLFFVRLARRVEQAEARLKAREVTP